MPKYDTPKGKGGAKHSPPPVPPVRPQKSDTARFRLGVPEEHERKIQKQRIEPISDGGRSTASIARPLPDAVAAMRSTASHEFEKTPYVPGNTLMPTPMRPSHTPDPEEEKKKAEKAEENDARFLRFANALYRASEIMQEDWVNWIADPSLLRENIGNAVEYLKEKRTENENYASDYRMLEAFSGMISRDEKLDGYLSWVEKRENSFLEMANVYAAINMSPLTPYPEVIGACREIAHNNESGPEYGGIADFLAMVGDFLAMVGDMEEYEGSAYLKGELYKRMFDAWYLRKAGKAMIEVYDVAMLTEERMAALLRVGELSEQVSMLGKDNEKLRKAGNVPPEVMAEVHNMRKEKFGFETKVAESEARAERFYRMLERVDEEADMLEAVSDKRYELMIQQAGMFKELKAEMDELKKQNAQIIAGLGKKNASLEEDKERMRSTIAELNAKLAMKESGKVVTDDDVERPTMLSEEFPVPEEVKEAAAEESDGIARLVSAMREREELETAGEDSPVFEHAVIGLDLPAREVTEKLRLDDVEEVPVARERGRFWKTRVGRVVDNIFVYGFIGEGNRRYPPIKENYSNDLEYFSADREYNSWYGQAGRAIRKTLENTRKNWKKITAVATSTVVLAAAATGYFMYAPVQERPGQAAIRELQRPAVERVAVVEEETPEKTPEVQEAEPEPEPLQKPALNDVLSKYSMELGEGTHIVNFYRDFSVEDVQERYVVLEEVLKSDELMQKYERGYVEGPVLRMYADFLNAAMEYAQLEGQAEAEKAGAREAGLRVAKRLGDSVQQKRIKKKLGKEKASEMESLANEFADFASGLPSAEELQHGEKTVEIPVVTPEELEEMKKNGQENDVVAIILPEKTDKKPFDMEAEMGKVIGAEFKLLDTPSKVNDFCRKAGQVEMLGKKFLMHAHLSNQIVEHGMETAMSEKRILFMHIDTMNAAILFAKADGQGMAAIAEALNAFDLANNEVKKFLGYKKMQKDIGSKRMDGVEKNLKWLRNRAEELHEKVGAYEKNKDLPVPLPGSPSLENGNGVPTAAPGKIKLDWDNEYVAIQAKVFSGHGLSILEHPLKIYGQIKGKTINSFDKFIILENLAERVMQDPRWMDGLSKDEQFSMLKILATYLRAATRAANTPKDWREGYDDRKIMMNAIYASDTLKELAKLGKANLPEKQEHLRFPLDQETFHAIRTAAKEFEEQLKYKYMQKARMAGTGRE
jgi:hypothetical protein